MTSPVFELESVVVGANTKPADTPDSPEIVGVTAALRRLFQSLTTAFRGVDNHQGKLGLPFFGENEIIAESVRIGHIYCRT